MDYTDPAGKLFLTDGKTVYLYTPANKEVEKFKMRDSEDMHVPLAFLLGKLNFDKEFQDFQTRQEDGLTWVAGKPLRPQSWQGGARCRDIRCGGHGIGVIFGGEHLRVVQESMEAPGDRQARFQVGQRRHDHP